MCERTDQAVSSRLCRRRVGQRSARARIAHRVRLALARSGGNRAGKAGHRELEEAFGLRDSVQRVRAEILHLPVAREEVARRLREKDLASVAGRADPRGAVDVETEVGVGLDLGRARVQADPNADRRALGPGCAASARWAPIAAAAASPALWKTAKCSSARQSTSVPPAAATSARRSRRHSLSTAPYSWSSCCTSRVDPSMSAKRRVTVPAGSSTMRTSLCRRLHRVGEEVERARRTRPRARGARSSGRGHRRSRRGCRSPRRRGGTGARWGSGSGS